MLTYIKPTSDMFIHYLLGSEHNKELLLSFINAVLENAGFRPLKDVQILNPFNLQQFLNDKKSILDIKARSADFFYNKQDCLFISALPRAMEGAPERLRPGDLRADAAAKRPEGLQSAEQALCLSLWSGVFFLHKKVIEALFRLRYNAFAYATASLQH